jgi:dTDP-4-amino-4,6-dideoxy-D-galactose acyltransferase
MISVERLDWDTEFFGYPVGRISIGNELLEDADLKEASSEFKLVFIVADKPLETKLLSAGDSKVVFAKTPEAHDLDDRVVLAEMSAIEEYKYIGRQSGIWSRFVTDPQFKNKEFERLYDAWVARSIENQIAFANFTILDSGKPTGLITIGETKPDTATIGLFAVSENHRGKGIGTQLLRAADWKCAELGYKYLTVATQGKNLGAQKVYQRFGFRPLNVTYIYNYWNEAHTIQ